MRTSSLVVLGATLALACGALAQQPPPEEPGPLQQAAPAPPATPPPAAARQGIAPRRVEGDVARKASQGTEALLQQRYAEAAKSYDAAQVRAPDLAELAYNRGLAALLAGKADEARQAFELSEKLRAEAAAKEPKRAPPQALEEDARFNDAHASWQADDLKGAVQRWASVVQGDSAAEDARRNLELALRLLHVQQQQQQQEQQQQQQDQEQQQQQQPQPQPPDEQQQEQPQDEQQQPEEQPQEPQPQEGGMTKEQAEQLLQALEASEKQAMDEKREPAKAVRGGRKPW